MDSCVAKKSVPVARRDSTVSSKGGSGHLVEVGSEPGAPEPCARRGQSASHHVQANSARLVRPDPMTNFELGSSGVRVVREYHLVRCAYLEKRQMVSAWPVVTEGLWPEDRRKVRVWFLEDVTHWRPDCRCGDKYFLDSAGEPQAKLGALSARKACEGFTLVDSQAESYHRRPWRSTRRGKSWEFRKGPMSVDVGTQTDTTSLVRLPGRETESEPPPASWQPPVLGRTRLQRRQRRKKEVQAAARANERFDTRLGWVAAGDHSIHGQGAVALDDHMKLLQPGVEFDSNAFTLAKQWLEFNAARVRVDGDVTVIVNSELSIQTTVNPERLALCQAAGAGTVAENTVLQPFRIRFEDSRLVATAEPLSLETYRPGGVINTRAVTAGMTAGARMSRYVAEGLALSLDASTKRYDNAALYAIGAILAMQRHVYSIAVPAIVPEYIAFPNANAFAYRNMNVDNAGVEALINALNEDIYRHAFVFVSERYDAADLVVMSMIANGLPRMRSRAESRVCPLQFFESPSIDIRVYGNGARNAPVAGAVSAQQIWATLLKMADDRGEGAQLGEGVIRAFTVLRGAIVTTGEAEPTRVNRWITALFEMEAVVWSAPADWNFMWRWLGIRLDVRKTAIIETEVAALRSFTVDGIFRGGHLIAQILSAFASTVFIEYNFSTIQLNQLIWQNYRQADVGEFGQYLFDNNTADPTAPFYWLVSEFVAQVSQWRIPPRAFGTSSWCNRRVWANKPAADSPHEFFRVLAGPIATLGDIPAIAVFLDMWPLSWGYLRPPIEANFDDDIIQGTNMQMSGWSAMFGESAYTDKIEADNVCNFIPYGLLVLNALRQRLNTAAFEVLYDHIKPAGRGRARSVNQAAVGVNTLEVVAGTVLTLPGKLLSYDWDTDTVLAPWVPSQNFLAPDWTFLVNMKGLAALGNCGVSVRELLQSRRGPSRSLGLARRMRWMSLEEHGGKASTSGKDATPEN